MTNWEFLKVRKMNIEVPEKQILQPYLRIQAWEGAGKLFGKTLIGESLQGLENHLPCCWYPGVDPAGSFEGQKKYIKDQIRAATEDAQVRETYEQMSKEEYDRFLREERQRTLQKELENQTKVVKMDKEKPPKVDNHGMPIELRHDNPDIVRPLMLNDFVFLNMQREQGFSPREGQKMAESSGESTRSICRGKLEFSDEYVKAFPFRNFPLLRNMA